MPSTVKGFGTHYHGKQNIARSPGVCQRCGFEGDLASYDTRLFFVLVFIRLIPLRRKRILNQCPRCSYHHVVPPARRRPKRRRSVSVAVAACAFIAALVISNEWIRRNRTLWIANGFDTPLTATTQGGLKVEVPPRSAAKLRVTEGVLSVTISGATNTSIEVDIRTEYLARWGDDDVRIVNPNGTAVIIHSLGSSSGPTETQRTTFHFGDEIVRLQDIEYAFRELPAKLAHKSAENSGIATSCNVFAGERLHLFEHIRAGPRPADALRFAERMLPSVPHDTPLLDAYISTLAHSKTPGIERFLQSGLGYRPISIAWHRHYQNTLRGIAHEPRLRAEYESMLSREPENASLLYLRGRLAATRAEALSLFQRARRADPQLAWAAFALGYDAIACGDFEAAYPEIEEAARLAPREPAFRSARNSLLFALGKSPELEKELLRNFNREPSDWRSARELSVFFAATGRLDEAHKVIGQVERRIAPAERASAQKAARAMELEAAYIAGDFAATEQRILATPAARNTTHGILSLLAKGRVDETIALPSFRDFLGDAAGPHMMVALAAELAGDTKNAATYRTLAIEKLSIGDPDARRAARILAEGETPAATLADVIIHPAEKALLCALLARRYPDKRDHYNALATKLNLSHDPIVKFAAKQQ